MGNRSSLLQHLRPGDYLVVALSTLACVMLAATLWGRGTGEKLVVRGEGKVIAQLSLNADREIAVQGPLGATIIQIMSGQARIARDPSPRQLCVRQGWIRREGEAAVCLPNRVSIEVASLKRAYDTLNY